MVEFVFVVFFISFFVWLMVPCALYGNARYTLMTKRDRDATEQTATERHGGQHLRQLEIANTAQMNRDEKCFWPFHRRLKRKNLNVDQY